MVSIWPFKAPGPDDILLELIKPRERPLKIRIHFLFLRIWESEEITELKKKKWRKYWKTQASSLFFKRGNRKVCDNYCRISLLSITGKIFALIFLNCLLILSESIFPESQCRFIFTRYHWYDFLCKTDRRMQRATKTTRNDILWPRKVFWQCPKVSFVESPWAFWLSC